MFLRSLLDFALSCSLTYLGPTLRRVPRLLTSIYDAALAANKKGVLFSSKTRGVPHVRDHCLLYTSDAADEARSVDLGGRS